MRTAIGCLLSCLLGITSYLFFRVFCRGTIAGLEHIEKLFDEGFILAPNHSSYMDWMVLGAVFRYRYRRPLRFLAKDRLFHHPIFGPLLEYERCIRVTDDGARIVNRAEIGPLLVNSVENGAAAVAAQHMPASSPASRWSVRWPGHERRDQYLCIFPEGKRTTDGMLGDAHPGIVIYAVKLRLPIVPVGLKGFYDAWPPGRVLPRARRCSIVFGTPYWVGKPSGKGFFRYQSSRVMANIAQLLGPSAR